MKESSFLFLLNNIKIKSCQLLLHSLNFKFAICYICLVSINSGKLCSLSSANTDKKKRLIVVEGWSCLRSVYGPHMDFICGGQWQEFRASIRRFVNTFQQVNTLL